MADKKTIAALSVLIDADNARFAKKMKQNGTYFTGMQKQALGLQKALIGVFAVSSITQFAKASMEAYNVQAQAEAGLLNALNGRKDIQEDLLDQASRMQARSIFGDESIIEQQKYLASLGLNKQAIIDTTEAAMQLSAATGISLESATKNLAKTYGGLTGELGELLPQLKDLTTEQLKAGDAIKYVNDNYKNYAETQAQSGLGQLQQAKNAWGDMKEMFGEFIAPGVTDFASEAMAEMQIWQDESLSFWQKLATAISDTKTEAYKAEQAFEDYWENGLSEMFGTYDNPQTGAAEDPIAIKIPLLQQLQDELKEAIRLQQAATDESELAAANREIQLLTEKIQKYKELGRVKKAEKETRSDVDTDYIYDWERSNYSTAPTESGMLNQNIIDMQRNMLVQVKDNNDAYITEMYRVADQLATVNGIIEGSMEQMVSSIAQGLGQSMAGQATNWSTALLTPLGNMAIQLGELAIAEGIAIEAIKASLESLNGPVAIAAGVALIAIGTAVKSSVSNMGKNMGSYGSTPSTSLGTGGGSENWYYERNIGERRNEQILIVEGRIRGEDIYLSNQRYGVAHNLTT